MKRKELSFWWVQRSAEECERKGVKKLRQEKRGEGVWLKESQSFKTGRVGIHPAVFV
jgi:hypothetical protein